MNRTYKAKIVVTPRGVRVESDRAPAEPLLEVIVDASGEPLLVMSQEARRWVTEEASRVELTRDVAGKIMAYSASLRAGEIVERIGAAVTQRRHTSRSGWTVYDEIIEEEWEVGGGVLRVFVAGNRVVGVLAW